MCTPGVGRVDWDRRPRSENRLGSPGGGGGWREWGERPRLASPGRRPPPVLGRPLAAPHGARPPGRGRGRGAGAARPPGPADAAPAPARQPSPEAVSVPAALVGPGQANGMRRPAGGGSGPRLSLPACQIGITSCRRSVSIGQSPRFLQAAGAKHPGQFT